MTWSILTNNFDDFARVKLICLAFLLCVAAYKCYAGSVMNTELVIGARADKLDSLSKMIAKKARFAFLNQWEAEIVRRSLDHEIRSVIAISEKRGSIAFNIQSGKEVQSLMADVLDQKRVLNGAYPFESANFLCTMFIMFGQTIDEYKQLKVQMDSVPRTMSGVVINERLFRRNLTIAKRLHRAIRIVESESLLAHKVNEMIIDGFAARVLGSDAKNVTVCARKLKDDQFSSVVFIPGVQNMIILGIICIALLANSLLSLIFELIRSYTTK
jgi:hypothetical protein